jgi:hypothetical protein
LAFSPTGRCPAFDVDPEIAGPALDKQRNDEFQLTQLISRDVPVAPLATDTDGGMNRVFLAKLDNPTYTYDDEGHLHVPPLQPGRLPPAISPPRSYQTDTTAGLAAPASSSVSGFFNGLFASQSAPAPAPVASTDTGSQTHTGLFGSLFGSKKDDAQQANASAEPPDTAPVATQTKSKPAAAAGLRPRLAVEPRNSASQVVDGVKPKPASTPAKDANTAAPPANNNGLLNGAQPVVPAGSFDSRFGSFNPGAVVSRQ